MRRISSTAALFAVGLLVLEPLLVTLPVQAQTTRLISDIVPAADLAEGFDPNAILDDRDIFNVEGMTLPQLRAFLNSRGTLGRIKIKDIDGEEKYPADIIWRISNSYKLNPQYLLVVLQKEQSLVEATRPTQKQFDWAMGYAVCDSCSMDDPSIQDFKGFANQLEYAAKQHRERYLIQLLGRGTTISGQAPGKKVLIDGIEITPRNNATAMLYTYTPHIHGNLNLWRIWRRWFSLDFPDGTLVQGKTSGKFYMIRNGQKRAFTSRLVAASISDIQKAVIAEDTELSVYPDGQGISFANYSIVETPEGKLYLIVGDTKRLIESKTVFRKFGFVEDDIVEGTEEELAAYEDGRDITANSQYLTGILAKDPKGTIWFVQDGERKKIPHPAFLNLYFKGKKPKILTQAQVDALKDVGAFTLRNGELVKSDASPAVYVVENATLRPIASGEAFEHLGWQWRNVITLPEKLVSSYPVGMTVDVQTPPTLSEPILTSAETSL
ncbi:hypothetical protein IT087_01245 [Candidatus Uhrbacteria bacterium]|nr:hypothetical protein [Candidatus Uhrbacteria bacterium]